MLSVAGSDAHRAPSVVVQATRLHLDYGVLPLTPITIAPSRPPPDANARGIPHTRGSGASFGIVRDDLLGDRKQMLAAAHAAVRGFARQDQGSRVEPRGSNVAVLSAKAPLSAKESSHVRNARHTGKSTAVVDLPLMSNGHALGVEWIVVPPHLGAARLAVASRIAGAPLPPSAEWRAVDPYGVHGVRQLPREFECAARRSAL